MCVKSAYILSGILCLISSLCGTHTQRRECGPGRQCKLLSSCLDEMNIKRDNFEDILMVLSKACEFNGRRIKVCCSKDFGHEAANLLPSKCGLSAADDKIKKNIFGAYKSPAPLGAYPWMAALGYTVLENSKPMFQCGGTIINSRYVLTAAHCVHNAELGRKKLSVVHLGDYNLATERDCEKTRLGLRCSNNHIVAGVEEIVFHPMYNKRGMSSDDVALIRLNLTLDFENSAATIGPVCLPQNGFNYKSLPRWADLIATGWGYTEHGIKSEILLQIKVQVADEAVCKEIYKENFVGNQLCVGRYKIGADTCAEDSGGPLFIRSVDRLHYFQVGITSFGPNICGLRNFPSVYTNVADYTDWIIRNMRP